MYNHIDRPTHHLTLIIIDHVDRPTHHLIMNTLACLSRAKIDTVLYPVYCRSNWGLTVGSPNPRPITSYRWSRCWQGWIHVGTTASDHRLPTLSNFIFKNTQLTASYTQLTVPSTKTDELTLRCTVYWLQHFPPHISPQPLRSATATQLCC